MRNQQVEGKLVVEFIRDRQRNLPVSSRAAQHSVRKHQRKVPLAKKAASKHGTSKTMVKDLLKVKVVMGSSTVLNTRLVLKLSTWL